MSRAGKWGVAAGAILFVALSAGLSPPSSGPKSKEELANENRIRAAYLAVKPDSAVFESVRVDDGAVDVCLTYRARNGFGGTAREHVMFVDGEGSQDRAMWNRHCARKTMYDLTGIARL